MEASGFLFFYLKLRKVFIGLYMISLSRYVIMQVLLPADFIVHDKLFKSWLIDFRKSCIFNDEKRQNSSFYHEKHFFTFSPPFFAFPHVFILFLKRGWREQFRKRSMVFYGMLIEKFRSNSNCW